MEFFSDFEKDTILRQARRDFFGETVPPEAKGLLDHMERTPPAQRETGSFDLPKYIRPPREYYTLAEEKYNLPAGSLWAIQQVENAPRNPGAVSPTGVRGLMQITRETGHRFGLQENEFWDPYRQIDTAARIMEDNLKRSGGNLERAFALYGDPNQKNYASMVMAHMEKPPEGQKQDKPGFSFTENTRHRLLPAREIDLGRAVYSASGLPDLPAYARAAGTGLVAGATGGLIDDPRAVTTTPQVVIHGIASMLGSAAPFSAAARGASAVGISKTLAGGATGLVYEAVHSRGQASVGQYLLSAGLGALYGKFYKVGTPSEARTFPDEPGAVYTRGKQPSVVFKESLAKAAKSSTDPNVRSVYMSYIREGERYPGYTYTSPPSVRGRFRSRTGQFVDEDTHELIASFDRFWKQVPDGEVRPSELIRDLHRLRTETDIPSSGRTRIPDRVNGEPYEFDGPQSEMFDIPEGSHASIKRYGRREYGRVTEGRVGPAPRVLSVFSPIIPTKSQILDVDESLGTSLYHDFFEKVEDARRVADGHVDSAFRELGQALRGSSRAKSRGMLEYAINPSDEVAKRFGLSNADVQAVNRAYAVWRKHWQESFGITPERYLREIVPKVRAARSVEAAFPNDPGTGDVRTMLEYARFHEANLKEKDFAKFLASHIRAAVYNQHFDPAYRTAMRIANERGLPGEVRDYLYHYLRDIRGGQSRFLDVLQGHVSKMWNILGAKTTEPEVRTYLHMLTDLTHTGLAGFSPSSLLKVVFHLPQTGGRMSFRWLWQGVREAMTPAGQKIAREAGMMGEFRPAVMDFKPALQRPAGVRFTRWLAKMGLQPHTSVYNFNRAATYLGQRSRTLAATAIRGLSEEEFMTRAGLWQLHPVLRRDITGAWAAGHFEEAADLAGKHMAQDTQWMYRQGYRAPAIRSELARYYGMFGVWPTSFLDYMRQMWTMDMPRIEQIKWFGRWFLGNSAVLGTLGIGAASVGMDPRDVVAHTMPWTYVGPLFDYHGGPIIDAFMALPRAYHALWNEPTVEKKIKGAAAPFVDLAKTPIPGINAMRAVTRARGELADIVEEQLGEDTEKTLGIAPPRGTLPSESRAEETYRILTGIKRTQ